MSVMAWCQLIYYSFTLFFLRCLLARALGAGVVTFAAGANMLVAARSSVLAVSPILIVLYANKGAARAGSAFWC